VRNFIRLFLFSSALGASVGLACAQTGLMDWNLAFSQPGLARASMSMVFDSGRGVTVMFGGRNASTLVPLSDTYQYAGTQWDLVATPHSPPARYWPGMAYDAHRQKMVLFGGQTNSTYFNDTWEFDGTDWTNIPTSHTPDAQSALSMTYDTCQQKTVLFSTQGATWEYDGTDWTRVETATAPPGRTQASMVFDTGRCRAVLFGGLDAGGSFNGLSDTWEFDGASWTQINTGTSPSRRWAHVMAFDTKRARTVLFGGYGPSSTSGQETNDTWEYDGTSWARAFTQVSPAPAEQRAMAYDASRSQMVLFGGIGPADAFLLTTAQFADVPPTEPYFDAANLMFEDGITTGCVPSDSPLTRLYCPNENVTREEMAAFIVRAITGTLTPAIYNHTPYFADVPASNLFFPHIQKLVDLGITAGCGVGIYCPTATIPRWEMAIFMVRARLGSHGVAFPTATIPYFADVPTNVAPNGVPFPYIQRSYEENITAGCGTNPLLVYCPNDLVTRGQMASFIMRGLFNETTTLPPTAPLLTAASPNTLASLLGTQITVTITGVNTAFTSLDTVTVPSGMLTVSNVTVNSATSISATLTTNPTTSAGPQSLVVTTGGVRLTLPLAIKVGTY
jgi:hypothetical protein